MLYKWASFIIDGCLTFASINGKPHGPFVVLVNEIVLIAPFGNLCSLSSINRNDQRVFEIGHVLIGSILNCCRGFL